MTAKVSARGTSGGTPERESFQPYAAAEAVSKSFSGDSLSSFLERSFTSHEVCRLTLVTVRMLQWWDETGIISPAIVGRCRAYRAQEVLGVMVIRELKERGFSLQQVRAIWRMIQRQRIEFFGPGRRWLVTNGARVLLLTDAESVLAILSERRRPPFVVIALDPLHQRLIQQAGTTRKPPAMERTVAQFRRELRA